MLNLKFPFIHFKTDGSYKHVNTVSADSYNFYTYI